MSCTFSECRTWPEWYVAARIIIILLLLYGNNTAERTLVRFLSANGRFGFPEGGRGTRNKQMKQTRDPNGIKCSLPYMNNRRVSIAEDALLRTKWHANASGWVDGSSPINGVLRVLPLRVPYIIFKIITVITPIAVLLFLAGRTRPWSYNTMSPKSTRACRRWKRCFA
jgi:hypothetical protein